MGSGCVGRGVGRVFEVWVGLGMRVGGEVGRARRSLPLFVVRCTRCRFGGAGLR